MYRVDLNSDLGESFGAYTIGLDGDVIKHVTSVNVACGFHAGDPVVMEKTVRLAKAAGAAVGAHPGFADLQGFGRRNMSLTPEEAKALVKYQIGSLLAFTKSNGLELQHVKAHGALYNMAAVDIKLARAIAEAVAEIDSSVIFLALAGSKMIDAGKECGLKVASEVFADRAYTDEGNLVSRSLPGSIIHDEELAIKRVIGMVKDGTVESASGKQIAIQADSICVHGDNPKAVEFVRSIREALVAEGIELANLAAIV